MRRGLLPLLPEVYLEESYLQIADDKANKRAQGKLYRLSVIYLKQDVMNYRCYM